MNIVKIFFVSIFIVSGACFSWNSCGSGSDPVTIGSLDAYQNQPMILNIKGQGQLMKSVQAPIKLVLKVQKKLFWGWTPVPCIGGFGSCTYNDICALTPYPNTCPDNLAGLPCNCPISAGKYGGSVVVDLRDPSVPKWLEKGQYWVNATATDASGRLFCITFTIQLK